MIVVKFGGTSMADAAAIRRAGEIVRSRLDRRPIVVVSAFAGVTNQLLHIGAQAVEGQLVPAMASVQALRDRHMTEARALLGDGPEATALVAELSSMIDELAALAEALSVLGHGTPRAMDKIAALGEQLSSLVAAAAFRQMGMAARHVDARDVMRTDDRFGKAEPQADEISDAARRVIAPMVRAGEVPVLGGFVGATAHRITTTLGRGGSDYSASLLGAALRVEAIEIWTDVDGMLTADPRVVRDARLITDIRFDEASELASFGAKVLHPSTIAPAVKLGIPVYVFNSRNPTGSGTRITFDAPRRAVTAIAGKKSVTVIKVRSARMLLQHGVLRHIFEVFERHRTSVDVVATSEVSVSVTIDDVSNLEALLNDLQPLGDVSVERNRGILALVGAGMSDDSQAMARALAALDGARVHMVSLSASGINLTLIVDGDQVDTGMQRLHAAFFGRQVAA
ncbi:MAG: lysine-sensitive aspartokinase 3 [Gemmatimonadetes bacterium]|nr:lysine-sensitive aspartokinase 3 [Gemmatimonadota bacterium]